MKNTGASNIGGTIVTAGGLVFIAATTDSKFRAFDSRTGSELWVTKLDASGTRPDDLSGPRWQAICRGCRRGYEPLQDDRQHGGQNLRLSDCLRLTRQARGRVRPASEFCPEFAFRAGSNCEFRFSFAPGGGKGNCHCDMYNMSRTNQLFDASDEPDCLGKRGGRHEG
jgi:hypothetical protein